MAEGMILRKVSETKSFCPTENGIGLIQKHEGKG